MNKCPCHSGKNYTDCCQAIHQNPKNALTASQLMRARYSAHALGLIDFFVNTTHRSTRSSIDIPALADWLKACDWQNLKILKTAKGQAPDFSGKVEFKAYYNDTEIHHELSTFQKEENQWYFVAGTTPKVKLASKKIGRNSPCPCGSGKKYKQCCGKK